MSSHYKGDLSGEIKEKFLAGLLSTRFQMTESMVTRTDLAGDRLFTSGSRPVKDPLYWEKRQKNNEAAKRSRERRRNRVVALENHLQELKQENEEMRTELAIIKRRFGLPPDVRMIDHVSAPPPGETTSCAIQDSRDPCVRSALSNKHLANHSNFPEERRLQICDEYAADVSNLPLCLKTEGNDRHEQKMSLQRPISLQTNGSFDYNNIHVKKENAHV